MKGVCLAYWVWLWNMNWNLNFNWDNFLHWVGLRNWNLNFDWYVFNDWVWDLYEVFDWDWTIDWDMDWVWDVLLNWVWGWDMDRYFYDLFNWDMDNFLYWVWVRYGNFVWNWDMFDMFNGNVFDNWVWDWYIFHNGNSFFVMTMMAMMTKVITGGSMMILSVISSVMTSKIVTVVSEFENSSFFCLLARRCRWLTHLLLFLQTLLTLVGSSDRNHQQSDYTRYDL